MEAQEPSFQFRRVGKDGEKEFVMGLMAFIGHGFYLAGAPCAGGGGLASFSVMVMPDGFQSLPQGMLGKV